MSKDASGRYLAGTRVVLQLDKAYTGKLVTATLGEASRVGAYDWTYAFSYDASIGWRLEERRTAFGFGLCEKHF